MSTATDTPRYKATLRFPSERELVITRVFDAPRSLVFEAMTNPAHVAKWYGPRSMQITLCEIDLRVGGAWRYVLCTPEGTEYAFSGTYLEIVPPERLVSTEAFEGMPGTGYVVTATFEEHAGKTTLRSHIVYQTQEHREGHLGSGMEAGMNETFDRLAEHLATLQA